MRHSLARTITLAFVLLALTAGQGLPPGEAKPSPQPGCGPGVQGPPPLRQPRTTLKEKRLFE
jgi:hypothetical protein